MSAQDETAVRGILTHDEALDIVHVVDTPGELSTRAKVVDPDQKSLSSAITWGQAGTEDSAHKWSTRSTAVQAAVAWVSKWAAGRKVAEGIYTGRGARVPRHCKSTASSVTDDRRTWARSRLDQCWYIHG